MHWHRALTAVASLSLALACGPGGSERRGEDEGAAGVGGAGPAVNASLEIKVIGLPADLSANLVFTDIHGKEHKLNGSASFDPLVPGSYRLRAAHAIQSGGTYYVTSFRGAKIDLAPGEAQVVEIPYERLPYSVRFDWLVVPWRGQAELRGRIVREPGFDEPLELAVEQLHGAFSASPARLTLPSSESEFRVVVENTGPLHSVEPRFGLTLVVDEGHRSFGYRMNFGALVMVTREADAGPGTLRYHLDHADEIPHPRQVHFAEHVRYIRLGSPLRLDSEEPLEIRGPSSPLFLMLPEPDAQFPPALWIDAGEEGRALEVRGTLRLRNIGFMRGEAPRGGCIRNEGSLSLERGVWLTGCRAEVGGAIASAAGSGLEIAESRLSWNEAEAGGAIHVEREGSARILKSALDRNQAARGGAVMALGTLELEESSFWRNYAEAGGAIESHGPLEDWGGVYGENRSGGPCGALLLLAPHVASLRGARFVENLAGDGGAICAGPGASLEVEGASFESNQASFGGAILADGAALSIAASVFTRNRAAEGGGGISATPEASLRVETSVFLENEGERGGAVFAAGRAEIFRSSFLENRARAGGAIFATGLHLENSSLAFNEARDAGGALSLQGGLFDLRFATLVENGAERGGGLYASGGTLSLGASIVALNEGGDLLLDQGAEEAVYSEGFNFVGVVDPDLEARLAGSDRFGLPVAPYDPGLAPISPTESPTIPLLPQSPAVDAVPIFYCEKLLTGPQVDQRGVRRPRGETCDAGAVEMY